MADTEEKKVEITVEKCDTCGKEFQNINPKYAKTALKTHMQVHSPSYKNSARMRSDTVRETLQEKVARLRKERKPIGQPERKWACPEGDGYQYRVFNDDWMTRPGNIQRALAAGYEFVDSEEEKQKPKIVGTNDNGTPIKGFLMRIPKEIFDEDQVMKQKEVDKVDEQIRAGQFQQGAGDKRYIPTTGIKISSDNRQPDI